MPGFGKWEVHGQVFDTRAAAEAFAVKRQVYQDAQQRDYAEVEAEAKIAQAVKERMRKLHDRQWAITNEIDRMLMFDALLPEERKVLTDAANKASLAQCALQGAWKA